MSELARLLNSQARAEIFGLLFGLEPQRLHLREIERRTGLSVGGVQQEMKNLKEQNLVIAERDGNRLYYRANADHPFFPEIHQLAVKSTGMVPLLRQALQLKGVEVAFVFGSLARGGAGPISDLDLLIIGEISLRGVTQALSGLSRKMGREINPHVFSSPEFGRRVRDQEHFVSRVMSEPKVFVIGGGDELEAMARERVDSPASNERSRNK